MVNQTTNPVLEALRQRRSVRKYGTEPVTPDQVRAVLEAGRWAPSGLNNQPWRFLVVMAKDPRQEKLAGCTKYSHIVNQAGCLIAVFLAREAMYHEAKDHQGAGACLQNMLLAVHALGLGAVWLGEIINQEAQVLGVLGLKSEDYVLEAVIALGSLPEPVTKQGDRKPLQDLLLEPLP